jgi:HAE1 family hydrophobic/amphiphilic exporter-1
MYLSNTSIKYPVFATMLVASLCVLGLFSYFQMGVDLMPRAEYPTVSVSASLRGASSEEIETSITKPIEEAVNTISGIDELRSSSSEGNSRVTITFALERDIDSAIQDVRDKVGNIQGRLPRDTDPPEIRKFDPDSSPILTMVVSGPRDRREITEIADRQIKQVLETVSGVGAVSIFGDRRREVQIVADARKLSAFGLTIDALRSAIQRQNVEVPGGNITSGDMEMTLRTMGRVTKLDDFNNIIVANQNGTQV